MSDFHRGGTSTSLVSTEPVPRRPLTTSVRPAPPAPHGPSLVAENPQLRRARSDLLKRAAEPGAAMEAFAAELIERGASLEWVCHSLIPDVARQLGHDWEEDRASFVDVTVTVCRLEQLVARLYQAAAPESAPAKWFGRVLVGAVPGEQHTLGVTLVAEALRSDGWDVALTPIEAEQVVLLNQLATEWFDLLALSASSERLLSRLPSLLRALRRASRNPGVRILLGGRPFCERGDLAEAYGADGSAASADRAVALAREFRQEGRRRPAAAPVLG